MGRGFLLDSFISGEISSWFCELCNALQPEGQDYADAFNKIKLLDLQLSAVFAFMSDSTVNSSLNFG